MLIKPKQKIILASLLSGLLFLLFTSASQATIVNPVIGKLGTADGTADGSKFIGYAVYLWKVSVNLGAMAVIVYFIWGAFEWITAGSDSKKTETARTRMTNAIVGLIVLVSAFTLLSFISKVFFGKDFDLLKLTLPTQLETSSSGAGGASGSSSGAGSNSIPASTWGSDRIDTSNLQPLTGDSNLRVSPAGAINLK